MATTLCGGGGGVGGDINGAVSRTHTAVPVQIKAAKQPVNGTPSTTSLCGGVGVGVGSKRGHIRSASLENANMLATKTTLGLPPSSSASLSTATTTTIGHTTGTLKSRNEQKRSIRSKYGSHSNLEDVQAIRSNSSKFQNIRQMFEFTKLSGLASTSAAATTTTTTQMTAISGRAITHGNGGDQAEQQMQSLPVTFIQVVNGSNNSNKYQTAAVAPATIVAPPQTQTRLTHMNNYQQQYIQQQQQQQQQQLQKQPLPLTRKPIPTTLVSNNAAAGSSGSRASITELSDRLNITESSENSGNIRHIQYQQKQQQQQQEQQQQQQRFHTHNGIIYGNNNNNNNNSNSSNTATQRELMQQRSVSDLAQVEEENRSDQVSNLLRPIAFKPIPFEPDYSIPNRYCDVVINAANNSGHSVADRYGSTPSLAPMQGSNLRFGSTTDLRHSGIGIVGGNAATFTTNVSSAGGGIHFIGGGGVGGSVGGYSSNNYCNNLMARRRNGSRSLKINDSMESIRHTPDSDVNSQSGGTAKSNGSSTISSNNNIIMNNNSITVNSAASKYSVSDQCDMTPSPSDSGISELEAALKDRDSELSYLRQTMEQNEKDKETYWENETKRLRGYYEAQQRDYLLKIKQLEQMLAMQQYQFKQNKLRYTDQTNKLREQVVELKNECEVLKTTNITLKNSERNLKDRSAYIEEQLEESYTTINRLQSQLEESEWKVCERNGELALLKTHLKEANNELTLKEHAIVHLKHENITNVETQIYQSLQDNQKFLQQQQQKDEELHLQNRRKVDSELKQLNKIVILKDQVILALTSELAKLRKELSDLAIFHEYGEEPSGKYTRLKQQLDNLTDICNKTRQHTQQRVETVQTTDSKLHMEKVLDDSNLELIMNCLKIAPVFEQMDEEQEDFNGRGESLNIEKHQNGALVLHNLPDVAVSVKMPTPSINHKYKFEESTLDTLIEESNGYAEQIAKLRQQLDEVRINFELEKRQWSAEKEKVLQYQKQLQTHYISMYQKLRNLEKTNEN